MKIKQTIKKIEEEIEEFLKLGVGKEPVVIGFYIRELIKLRELQAKLSGYKLALKEVLSEIDEKINEFKQIKSKIPEKYKNVESTEENQELRLNASLSNLEELKKPIQEILKDRIEVLK